MRIGGINMIGFYDYTVILTYLGFCSGVAGIFCASVNHVRWAVFFLALSGLCDMFDGKIARTKKNRTEDEKSFGIQIDSLSDMVCFGILPVLICFRLGMKYVYSMAVLTLYALAGLIRLAYYNVMEAKRPAETDENRKYYQGLPITSMAIALPFLFVFSPLLTDYQTFLAILHILVAVIGILFIVNFKMRKPTVKELVLLVTAVAAAVAVIVFIWHSWWKLLHFYK